MKNITFPLLMLLSGFSFAQKQQNDTLQLEEIMVTAQKVSAKQLKVPMSVKAIGAKKIHNLQLDNVNELGRIAPNFQTYDDGGGVFPIFASRGFFTIEQTPVIGIYIDDVPVFDTFTIGNQLHNIEKVEVIKGAQGMLYGRSAIGGVIKITTKQPNNETSLNFKIGAGNLNQKVGSIAFQNALVKDKLFIGANFLYNKRDGYVKNTVTNVDLLNRDVLSGGINLHFQQVENLKMVLRSNFSKSQTFAYALVGGMSKQQKFLDEQKRDNAYKLEYDTQGDYKRFVNNNSFTLQYKASTFDLNAITTYQHSTIDRIGEDMDWTKIDVNSSDMDGKTNNFSQEIRFNSNTESDLQWLAGVFIHNINNNYIATTNNGIAAGASYTGTDAAQYPYSKVVDPQINQLGFALFTNFDYAVTEELKMNAGVRYEKEYQTMDAVSYHTKNGKRFSYDGTQLKLKQQEFDAKTNFGAFSYKGGFSYEIADGKLLWGSVGRGYRPGGVNQFSENHKTFNPEYSFTTELGFKGKFFNNLLRGDITAFYTNYEDQQVFNVTDPATFTAAKMNLGNSYSYGAEFDTQFLVSKNLAVDASAGYLKTEITDFKVKAGFPAKEVDYSGKRQPYAPVVNTSLGILYRTYFSDDLKLSSYVDYQHQTTVYFDYDNKLYQPAYGLLNANIDLSYKNYTLTLWTKNLTNEVYYSYGYSMLNVYNFASYGLPRTFGASISATF